MDIGGQNTKVIERCVRNKKNEIAAKYILDNIRAFYGNSAGLVLRIASFRDDTSLKLNLGNFSEYHRFDPWAIYKYVLFFSCLYFFRFKGFCLLLNNILSSALKEYLFLSPLSIGLPSVYSVPN